jgi:CelD/BcsL family acetyltransferase involved in cellulose biosynthesis
LPAWIKTWWQLLSPSIEPHLIRFEADNQCLGYAPVYLKDSQACLLGDQNVCDYLDVVATRQDSRTFGHCLLDYFAKTGISVLDLNPVRADSYIQTQLAPIAKQAGCRVISEETDTVYEMRLPSQWEDYLQRLKGKHRHEIRRKFRRLHEAGEINYQGIQDVDALPDALDLFFRLFNLSSARKAAFMTPEMKAFFRSLIKAMAQLDMVRLNFLKIDGEPAAATLCFDDQSTVYLYNNGYDPRFQSLSVGLLCKVMGIRDSIAAGRKAYSFLKGKEAYKQRLGGQAVPIYRCRIHL